MVSVQKICHDFIEKEATGTTQYTRLKHYNDLPISHAKGIWTMWAQEVHRGYVRTHLLRLLHNN